MEISRRTKYPMNRGATFCLELLSTNYRRSPLVQGGLEIPAKVTVKMPGTVRTMRRVLRISWSSWPTLPLWAGLLGRIFLITH